VGNLPEQLDLAGEAAAQRHEATAPSAPASRSDFRTEPDAAPERRTLSLLHYAPALILVLVIVADAGQRTDPDLWGHLRFGQTMLAHHGLYLTDPYSYSAAGAPWRNHEWLTEFVMALAYNHMGVVGLKLWKFACVAATILFLVLGLAETGATAAVQFNTLIVASVALMPQMQFRPQLFTFFLFAGLLALLARHNYRGSAPLWLAIPMMALWGNVHGGYLIGIATLAAYAGVVGIQDLFAGRGLGRTLKLGLLTTLGTLATLISPYGIDNWLVVLNALRVHAVRVVILDWEPLTRAMAIQWHTGHLGILFYLCVLGLIAAFVVSFVLQPAGDDLPLVVVAAMMSVAAFLAVRNMPLAVIACSMPVARHSWLILQRRSSAATKGESAPARSGVNSWFALAVAAILVIATGVFSTRIKTEVPYPAGAIRFMKAKGLAGNVLVDFNWAEYFMWHAPESKVFFDGRYDSVYSLAIVDQYLAFYFGKRDAPKVLKAYPHEFVLIPPSSAAYTFMTKCAGWKLIYHDRDSALFARADLPAVRLTGVPITGANPPMQYFP
jgi:hypothetical protein